jgi:hypothetical protein
MILFGIIFYIAYLVKFHFVYLSPGILGLLAIPGLSGYKPTAIQGLNILWVLVAALVGFALASSPLSIALLQRGARRLRPLAIALLPRTLPFSLQRIANLLLGVALGLIVFTSVLTAAFDLVQGGSSSLPKGMAGGIVFARIYIIPGILLAGLEAAHRSGQQKRVPLWICIALLFGLSDTLLRASKSVFIIILILLFCYYLFSKRKVIRSVAVIGIVSLLFIPITYIGGHLLRMVRHRGVSVAELAADPGSLVSGYQALQEGPAEAGTATMMYSRLTGVDMLFAMDAYGARPLGPLGSARKIGERRGLNSIVTIDIFASNPDVWETFGLAPSLLGALWIIGGVPGVFLGTLAFVAVCGLFWALLQSLGRHLRFAVTPLFFTMTALYTIDGTIDVFFTTGMLIFGFVLCCSSLFLPNHEDLPGE